ncbi:MAG: hypothetical protein EBS39_07355, partial [Gammaproteobacteria bacterium]|nr:hypothetical protein [Gammaproteobacteria bacterium]
MSDTLFLRLRSLSPSDEVECCVADRSGVTPTESLPLSALASRAGGRRIVAFLPSAETLGVAVSLPPMSAAKARAALPYALEDQLAGDLEEQHFAVGARLADGRWPVRVIALARLAAWLDLLRGAGIEPQALVAEADALRDRPGDLMLWLDGDDAHWRAPGSAPVTLPSDVLPEGAAAALGDARSGTLGLRVLGRPEDLERHADGLAAVAGGFLQRVDQSLPQSPLSWLASQFDATAVTNLLQGSFAPARGPAAGLEAWRWPIRLAIVALVLQVFGWGLEAWRLHRAAQPLDAALLEAVRPLDPSVQDPATARSLLTARLADWDRRERDPSAAPFIAALATLADARAAAPAVELIGLRLTSSASARIAARLGAGADLSA